jgi:hypothetical protein
VEGFAVKRPIPKPRTEAQNLAHARNWNICRLRGLKGLAGRDFLGPEYEAVQSAIDRRLGQLGATERTLEEREKNAFKGMKHSSFSRDYPF